MRIALDQLEEARALLRQHFAPTPLVISRWARSLGNDARPIFLKVETGLPTGSFKVRGAMYALSTHMRSSTPTEVVAASTGNHGAAVAWAAGLSNLAATIFVPTDPNPVKARRIEELGARIVEAGADLTAAIDAAGEYAARTGAFFLHDASSPLVPIGAGTIGLEIVEALPAVQTVYVPMGDTALIRGVASALKHRVPGIRIVGVVAERAPAYFLSWQRRLAVETASAGTIADGLAIRRALQPNVDDICMLVDDVVSVSEEDLLVAIRQLMREEQIEAEPAGAAAFAALSRVHEQTTAAQAPSAGTAVALVTGGNLAPDLRARLMPQ